MALKKSITIADTGIICPDGYGRIESSVVALGAGLLQVTVNWYGNQSLSVNFKPSRVDQIVLPSDSFTHPNPDFVAKLAAAASTGAIISPQDALKAALYILIQQLPAYADAAFV